MPEEGKLASIFIDLEDNYMHYTYWDSLKGYMLGDKKPKHEDNTSVSEIKPNKFSGLVKTRDNLLCWKLILANLKVQVEYLHLQILFLNAKPTETDFHLIKTF